MIRFFLTIGIFFVSFHSAQAQVPELSQYGSVAQRSMESACSTDRVMNGPAAYANCLNKQISQYSGGNKIPELSQYGSVAQRSMESACSTDRVMNGPAAYANCLNKQISQHTGGNKIPDLRPTIQQATASSAQPSSVERDRLAAEVEAERKKRQELEQQLALNKERERITADLDAERRRRQELEEQLRVGQPRPVASQTASNSSIGKRIALVVGNANYKVRPLKNSVNDADDVSRSLKASGFEVIVLRDATLSQMRTAVRQFGDRLINNDVGLVYYSGHGVEVKGRNYFIPVNADIQREDEIADQGLDVSLILEKMSTAGKGVNILIVDACRDDPFGRSFRSSSRGLANMDAPRGTIIAYATSPGKVASDGDPRERNSPYTKHLVKAMQSPNKPIEQVFKEVRRAVQDETKNLQTPWENTSLSGDFFFRVQK
jgi:hypothetical protein